MRHSRPFAPWAVASSTSASGRRNAARRVAACAACDRNGRHCGVGGGPAEQCIERRVVLVADRFRFVAAAPAALGPQAQQGSERGRLRPQPRRVLQQLRHRFGIKRATDRRPVGHPVVDQGEQDGDQLGPGASQEAAAVPGVGGRTGQAHQRIGPALAEHRECRDRVRVGIARCGCLDSLIESLSLTPMSWAAASITLRGHR